MSYPNVDKVIERMMYYHLRYVVDGDPVGNKIIGTEIFKEAGIPIMNDYDNKKVSWCGLTLQACFHYAGYDINIASVGKALYGFGMYNKINGKPAFDNWPDYIKAGDGNLMLIYDYHKKMDNLRIVSRDIEKVRRGDILLNQNDEGGKPYNGHVMMCLDNIFQSKTIYTLEGNAIGFMPPKDGKVEKKEGVVIKSYKYGDKYLEYWIRPSPLDLNCKFFVK